MNIIITSSMKVPELQRLHDIHCNAHPRSPKYEGGCSCYKPGCQGHNYMSISEALRIYRSR